MWISAIVNIEVVVGVLFKPSFDESDKLANGTSRTTELFACPLLEPRDAQLKDFKTLRYATKDSKQTKTAVIDFVCKGNNIFIF